MIEIKGTYSIAKVFAEDLEGTAAVQIKQLCDMEYTKGSKIRIMPDVHAGAGCTIGTTMTIFDKVVPNLVGVDIGCGMETVRLSKKHIELEKLDKLIYEKIPSGMKIRKTPHKFNDEIDLGQLKCKNRMNLDRAVKSIGTLGGGNHFIEVDRDEDGNLYLVVHSGSRHLGKEAASYYQEMGYKHITDPEIPSQLAYVEGELFRDYIHDMRLIQHFAALNRKAIVMEILTGMKLDAEEQFTTIHNYIDTDKMILRKGAVSAEKGKKLLIPINMRDGSLICLGKGNEDWNYSAPHGAGRLMSRTEARNQFTVSEFKKQMKNIYTTSVHKDTLDECPMAYKDINVIVGSIGPTAQLEKIIKPIYNFKAKE